MFQVVHQEYSKNDVSSKGVPTTIDKNEMYSIGDFKYPPPNQMSPEIGRLHVKIHDS